MPITAVRRVFMVCVGIGTAVATITAQGGRRDARFHDVAADVGITYARTPSASDAVLQTLKESGPVTMAQLALGPARSRGVPGVALLDYDSDGDLDIYVTNGPGTPNSLYRNDLVPGGQLRFEDVAIQTHTALTPFDSTGVCYGDTDNDGDPDLLVLSRGGALNQFLENGGRGVFENRTGASAIGGYGHGATSCSMGDVNGDGLLDIYVSNAFDLETMLPLMVEPFALNHPNQLWINTGDNRFVDGTAAAGIGLGKPEVTWASAIVDYDRDGDLDIIEADDQAAIVRASKGGVDRGPIRIYRNDGSGRFSDASPGFVGAHMGLDFADLNHDGHLDMVVADGGDYLVRFFGVPYDLGDDTTRWYLGDGAGGFADPGVGDLVAGTFAWGIAAEDYDNDGDTDILHAGGMEAAVMVESSNPGTVLKNDGAARFRYDDGALDGFYLRRNEQGLAMGDLDLNGTIDIVSVSDQTFPEPVPLVPFPFGYGSVWDPAMFVPMFAPVSQTDVLWTGVRGQNGTVAVLLNSGSGLHSARVKAVGTSGVTVGGRAPRDGIGAVVTFTPRGLPPAMRPVVGGSSYASQHALERHFGMGESRRATVDVLWPGGVRNRLYDVEPGDLAVVPEIPCSIDSAASDPVYARCVLRAAQRIGRAGLVEPRDLAHAIRSALRARRDR
jgi:enediyne biosynthesis protein E4